MTSSQQTQKPSPVAIGFVSIAVVAAIVIAVFLLRNQSSIPKSLPATVAQQSWEIPVPDTHSMEPQVGKLIDETRDLLLNNQDSVEAWGKYGMILDAHFVLTPAATCYRRACELAPDEFTWPYLLAIIFSQNKSTVMESVEWFRKAAQLDSQYLPLYLRLGEVQMKRGMTTEAQTVFQQALSIDAQSAMAHRGLGQVLIMMGETAEAVTHLELASKLAPNDSTSYASLATAYTQLKLPDRAQRAMQQSKKLSPQKYYDDPIRNEVELMGISSVACLSRADQYMMLGDYPSAIEEFLIAAYARPYDATVHLDLAKAYRASRNGEKVVHHLTRAVEIQDDLVDIHVVLGNLKMAKQDMEQAIHHYRRATANAADNSLYHSKLAGALARNGNFEEALVEFNLASDLGPLNAPSFADWGTTLLSMENFSFAVNRFQEAILLDPDHIISHAGLAVAYEQLGQIDNAIAEYEWTLSINPNHPARQRLDRLRASQNTP